MVEDCFPSIENNSYLVAVISDGYGCDTVPRVIYYQYNIYYQCRGTDSHLSRYTWDMEVLVLVGLRTCRGDLATGGGLVSFLTAWTRGHVERLQSMNASYYSEDISIFQFCHCNIAHSIHITHIRMGQNLTAFCIF